MEQIGQNYGFIVYRSTIPDSFYQSSAIFGISGLLRDRAIIYVGKVRQATMFGYPGSQTLPLDIGDFLQLDILVENMGRPE